MTNESGIYVKERLLPGTYEVKAELQGFKAVVFSSIKVSVDTQTSLNIKLETGAVSESVTVAGFSPVLKTDRADVATTFDSKEINDLPVLDRNFTKFILLTPGTQQLGWQHAASENPQGSTQTMVNGQHFSGTGYQLDGTENRDPILGIIVINPNFEAIGESKDHLAELRRGVRAGDRGGRLGADEVRQQPDPRERLRVLPERRAPGAQSVHAGDQECRDRSNSCRRPNGTSTAGRSAVRSRRIASSSSATTRGRAATSAGRSCSRCPRRRPQRRSQRVRGQHLRSDERRDAGAADAVPEQRHSRGACSLRRPRTSSS